MVVGATVASNRRRKDGVGWDTTVEASDDKGMGRGSKQRRSNEQLMRLGTCNFKYPKKKYLVWKILVLAWCT